jgi:hypothetical protein
MRVDQIASPRRSMQPRARKVREIESAKGRFQTLELWSLSTYFPRARWPSRSLLRAMTNGQATVSGCANRDTKARQNRQACLYVARDCYPSSLSILGVPSG